MIKQIWLFFCLLPVLSLSQDFSFSPGPVLDGQMDVDGYGLHQIDILNETEDTLWLTWRMIGNTMPDEWDVNLCDNVICYGVMPTMADMNPVAPDSAAFIRITTYPGNVAGSGQLLFWIYKTGFSESHSTIAFNLSAGITGISEREKSGIRVFPNPTTGPLRIAIPEEEPFTWTLYDALGRISRRGQRPDLDLSALPKGNYWLQIDYRNRQTLFPVQKQ